MISPRNSRNMEEAGLNLKKDDSFEILPHLSEDDRFIEAQKYRHLKKYANDLTSETISLWLNNMRSISEIEFCDISNSSGTSDSESDIIVLESSSDYTTKSKSIPVSNPDLVTYNNKYSKELTSSNKWSISEAEFYDIENLFDTSDSESDFIVLKSFSDFTAQEKFSSEIETVECDSFVQEIVPIGESLGDPALKTTSVNNLDLFPCSNKFENSETNSIPSNNMRSISETEFYDVKNLFDTSDSDFIGLESSSDFTDQEKFLSEIETVECNSFVQEIASIGESLGDNALKTLPASNLEMVPYNNQFKNSENEKGQLKTKNLHLEFPLNTEGVIGIILDKVLRDIFDVAYHTVSKNTLPCGDTGSEVANESTAVGFGSKTEPALLACEGTEHKRTAVTVHRGRSISSKRICEVFNNGIKFCEWLQGNRIVRAILESAKFSFNSFVNLFEMEFNLMRDIEEECLNLTLVSEESHCRAIEEAFSGVFHGRVSFSRVIPLTGDSIQGPVLPVGHLEGVRSAEMKIHSARQSSGDSTVISTSTLLYEATSKRWQMTTVICLDDPRLHLQLHNFTVSTPILNEFLITEAKIETPLLLRDIGYAVSLEQTASSRTPAMVSDIQSFLAGYNSYTSLKSAALVLAGMYKKYL